MKLIKEYEKQIIFILLGSIVFLFPLFKGSYFILALSLLGMAILFSIIQPTSSIFRFLSRKSDIKAGKLIGLSQLFLTIAILLIISLIVGVDRFPLFIIGAAFAITTFGDGVADIINIYDKARKNESSSNDIKIYSARSSIIFLVSGGLYAFLAGSWIWSLTGPVIITDPYGMIFFLAVIGAITGALLESITITEDNIIIPFGSSMTMWLFYTFSYNVERQYLIQVLIFAFVLGYLAYRARIADISAMLSATLLGVVIIISSGIGSFFILLAFFFLGSLFTRYKYDYKLALGAAEKKGGVRGYKNVFSNSLAALALAILYGVFPSYREPLLYAYLGSIATACGDTLASEIGQTYRGEPVMITTLKKVRAGTDGAVSGLGEGAAFFGALAIACLGYLLLPDAQTIGMVIAIVAGGFIGTNIDSVLGATLQRKGYLTNNGVNLFATISGAIVSGILYYLVGS